MTKNISRRRALGFAATSAGIAGATTVAMSVNPALASASTASPQPAVLPNALTIVAHRRGEDQTGDIQDALDEAEANGGGVVYLEGEIYRISRTLLIGQNVTLTGEGAATELRATGSMNWMVEFPPSSFWGRLTNIRLLGGGDAGGVNITTAGTGMFSGNDAYVLIENVAVHDIRNNGVRVGASVDGFGTREIRLHNVVVLRAQSHGILFYGVDSIISNCTVAGSGLDGFHIEGGNNRITGCKAFFNNGSGITVNGSRGQLSACQVQDNNGDGFKIDNANDVALSACGADSNRFVGVRIRNCLGVTFSSASSISRAGRFEQVFGVRIQNSANCRITGVSRNNATNLNVVNSPAVDTSGLLHEEV